MGDCACIYVENNDDYPEIHSEKRQKARKEHNCCECGRVIKKGEIYEYASGKWNGDFRVFKTCEECLDLRNTFFCEGFTYTRVHKYLWNHLQDMGGELSEDCLAGLDTKAREIVCNMIKRIQEG